MKTIIEVFHNNNFALYHLSCYTERDDDIVYTVLRLRSAGKCKKCGVVIDEGQHFDEVEEVAEVPTQIVQLTLF